MVTVRRSVSGCSVRSSAARRSNLRGSSWVASSVGRSSLTVPPCPSASSSSSNRLGLRSAASILRSHWRSTASRLMSSLSCSRRARAPAVCIGPLSCSPAGLADGLALKESRYALRRFAPDRTGHLGPPRSVYPRSLGFDDAAHASTRADAPDRKTRCLRGKCNEICKAAFRGSAGLLAGDGGHVGGHGVRVRSVEEPGRHPPRARAAALDRIQDALLVERRKVVEVRPGHPVRVDGVERVAALAVLDEERLPVLQ